MFPSKFRKSYLLLVVRMIVSLCTPKMSLESTKGRRIESIEEYGRLSCEAEDEVYQRKKL